MTKIGSATRSVLVMCASIVLAAMGIAEPAKLCTPKPAVTLRPAESYSITVHYMSFRTETLIPTSETLIKFYGGKKIITSENDARHILSLMQERVAIKDYSERKVGRRIQGSGYEGDMVRVLVEENEGEHRFFVDRSGVIRDGKHIYVLKAHAYKELDKIFVGWSDESVNEALREQARASKGNAPSSKGSVP